jgi:hypothetical protein
MESAAETLTSGNLADASFHIDCALNRDGYAQRNPELVAAFIQTQAIHLQTLMQRRTGQEIRDALLAIAAKLGGAVR